MTVWEFLSTRNAGDLIRLLEGVVGIVAAILSGVAVKNILEMKRVVGAVVKKSWWRRLLHLKGKHETGDRVDAKPDAFQSLTLAQKVDMLKNNQEIQSLRIGVVNESLTNRLNRVDPPDRRH